MKTIVLVEESDTGHRPAYIKLFSQILLKLGCQVIALFPKAKELQVWVEQHCNSYAHQFYSFEFRKPNPSQYFLTQLYPFRNALALWQHSKRAIDEACKQLGKSPDLVFFNYLDSFLAPYLTHQIIDRLFPYPWSGLYIHPRHLRLLPQQTLRSPNFLKPHSVLYSASCPVVALLDEGVADSLQKQLLGKPVIAFPDCIDKSAPDFNFPLIKLIEEQAQGRKIVGLLGSQSQRKGILTLIEVAQRMQGENFFFLFAGNLYPNTFTTENRTKLLDTIGLNLTNCLFYWQIVPEHRFNALVSTCDILFASYERFPHSSNMLNKAAHFNKPIIVSKNYCMAERVAKFKLGLSINEGNVSECINSLRYLAQQPLIESHFDAYISAHSPTRLSTAFQQILEYI